MALKAKRYANSCFPLFNLGRVYEARGEFDKALQHFRSALEENPRYDPAAKSGERVKHKLAARDPEAIL